MDFLASLPFLNCSSFVWDNAYHLEHSFTSLFLKCTPEYSNWFLQNKSAGLDNKLLCTSSEGMFIAMLIFCLDLTKMHLNNILSLYVVSGALQRLIETVPPKL